MIAAWVTLQGVVAVIVVAAWGIVRVAPRHAVALQRALLLAVPLAFVGTRIPSEAPFEPPAQVWAPSSGAIAPRVAIGSAAPMPIPVRVPWAIVLLPLATIPALGAVLAVRRALRGSRVLRRVGRVEVRIAPGARTPFAVWLGRPIVALDPDTAFDPALTMVALRHELQHHRAGDPVVAWILLALGVASPIALLLRRPFAEAEEIACDRALVSRGTPPLPYARALATIALRALPGPALASSMTPFLPRRLAMLTRPAPSHPVVATVACLAALGVSIPLGWAGDGLLRDHRVDPAVFATHAAALEARGAFLGADAPQVAGALDRLVATPEGLRWATASLDRAKDLRPGFEARLAEAGLPTELSAVVMVESGWRNRRAEDLPAAVPAGQRGAGYWMFIAPTARKYGLRVDDGADERLDVSRETEAAIALFQADYARYGDWGLALAAYNQGERAVDRAVATEHTSDAFVLQARGALNDYVAQVYAAAIVQGDPSLVR